MSTSNETMIFDADAAKYIGEMMKIEVKQKELQANIRHNTQEAVRGSALAKQATIEQRIELHKLDMEYKLLKQSLTDSNTQQSSVNTLSDKNKQIMQQLSYAVGDAASTFGTGGLSGALRGAGNNLEMVAGLMFGPVVGGITAVGIALLPAIAKMTGLASSTKESEEAFKDAQKAADSYGNTMSTLEERIQKLIFSEEQFEAMKIDREKKKALAEFDKENAGAVNKAFEAQQKITDHDAKVQEKLRAMRARGATEEEIQAEQKHQEAFFGPMRRELNADAAEGKRLSHARDAIGAEFDRAKNLEATDRLKKKIEKVEKEFDANFNVFLPGGMDFDDDSKHKDKFDPPAFVKRRVNRLQKEATDARRAEEDATTAAHDPHSPGGKRVTRDEQRAIDALHQKTTETNRLLQDAVALLRLMSERDVASTIGQVLAALGPAGALVGQGFMPQPRQRGAQR